MASVGSQPPCHYKIGDILGFTTPGHYRLVAAVGYELKPLRYVQKPKRYNLEG